MSARFSPDYAELQRQFHTQRPDYGISGARYADQIQGLAKSMQTRDILDYGCGKATLSKALPFPIQNYDPFIEDFCAHPIPSDIVVCTDVLEHIEYPYLHGVLEHINSLTKKVAFFQIATRPASKQLPDGRNAHLIIEPGRWWIPELLRSFNILQYSDNNGGILAICTPLLVTAQEK